MWVPARAASWTLLGALAGCIGGNGGVTNGHDGGGPREASTRSVDAAGVRLDAGPRVPTPGLDSGADPRPGRDAGAEVYCPELEREATASVIAATLGIDAKEFETELEGMQYDTSDVVPALLEACAKGSPRPLVHTALMQLLPDNGLVFTCDSELTKQYQSLTEVAEALDLELGDLTTVAEHMGVSETTLIHHIEDQVHLHGGEDELREWILSGLIDSLVGRSWALTVDLGEFAQLPGAEVTRVVVWTEGHKLFDLQVEQPYDHSQPDGPSFMQRVEVRLHDPKGATVFGTGGYSFPDYAFSSDLLTSNAVGMPHRFYDRAPADADLWQFLTPEQAAADAHRVVELLQPLLTGPWVSTGFSKGGSSALLHRRYFPEDVVGTIAYVAPLGFQGEPSKGLDRLDAIAKDICVERVRDLQRFILENLPALQEQRGEIFCLPEVDPEVLLDAAAQFEWGFWTTRAELDCADLSPGDITLDEARLQLEQALIGFAYSSASTGGGSSWRYEKLATWGEPTLQREGVPDLVAAAAVELGIAEAPRSPEPPWGQDPSLDDSAMEEARAWMATHARDVVLIYGEYDPWSAWAVDVPSDPSVLSITVPSAVHWTSHSDAQSADRDRMRALLERWVGEGALIPGAFD